MVPPPAPPSGPISMTQSDVLITSRLCSMTITELPLSTRPLMTSSNLRMSSKCKPVVGSSRMYTVRPVERFCNSDASFTRCASQPDVSEADIDQRPQVAMNAGDRLEELRRLLDRHVQHLRDGLALVVHLQG